MSLVRWMQRFLFDAAAAPSPLNLRDVPVDPKLAARNARRTAAARKALGERWLCARPVRRRAAAMLLPCPSCGERQGARSPCGCETSGAAAPGIARCDCRARTERVAQ